MQQQNPKIYILIIGIIAFLMIGIVACNQAAHHNKEESPWYFNEKKDSYKISILPIDQKEVEYEFSDLTTMQSSVESMASQSLVFNFSLVNRIDSFILNPKLLKYEIKRPDGSIYQFDTSKDEEGEPLLKELVAVMDHKMDIFTDKNREIKYMMSTNLKTNERSKVFLQDRASHDPFITMVIAMFDFLPMQEVKMRQTWKTKSEVVMMGYNFLKKSNFTLVEVNSNGIATIIEATELTTNDSNLSSWQDFNMKVKLNGVSEAYYIVDLNKGILNSADINLEVGGNIQTTSEVIPINIQSKGRFINKF